MGPTKTEVIEDIKFHLSVGIMLSLILFVPSFLCYAGGIGERGIFDTLDVSPIHQDEVERLGEYIRCHHYLDYRGIAGGFLVTFRRYIVNRFNS